MSDISGTYENSKTIIQLQKISDSIFFFVIKEKRSDSVRDKKYLLYGTFINNECGVKLFNFSQYPYYYIGASFLFNKKINIDSSSTKLPSECKEVIGEYEKSDQNETITSFDKYVLQNSKTQTWKCKKKSRLKLYDFPYPYSRFKQVDLDIKKEAVLLGAVGSIVGQKKSNNSRFVFITLKAYNKSGWVNGDLFEQIFN